MIDIEKIIQHNVGDALKKLKYDFDPGAITLERPKVESHGDLSTNIAMQLASVAKKIRGKSPRNSLKI